MNILHINMNYDQSKIHYNIVKYLNCKENVEGKIFFPSRKNQKKIVGVDFLDQIQCLNKYDRFFYKQRNKYLFNKITEIYTIENYDYILAHSLFSNGLLAMNLKLEKGIRYNVIITNTDMNLYFKKIIHLRKIGIEILKNAEKIFFSSPTYLNMLVERYISEEDKVKIKAKSRIIPFGIDDFWIENKFNKNKKTLKKDINILYAGKINKNKNINSTINACQILIDEGFNIKYTIIGKITDSYGNKVIKNLNKYKFIDYHNEVKFQELINFYRNSDIFIMPSHAESFGLVYAEAMSQGVPVIYSKNQGFDEQFKDGVIGKAVESNDINEIKNAIKYIIKNYDLISRNCYINSNVFSWDKITERFLFEFLDVGVEKH